MKPHVHYLLGRKGTTASEIGRRLDITPQYAHALLIGIRTSRDYLARIAGELDVSVEVLGLAIAGEISLGKFDRIVGNKAA